MRIVVAKMELGYREAKYKYPLLVLCRMGRTCRVFSHHLQVSILHKQVYFKIIIVRSLLEDSTVAAITRHFCLEDD